MLAALGATALSAGLGAYQSSVNAGMQRETNQMNYEMWQKQLDYDRPINQVNRLKEAGLNPALMYGTGSGANVGAKPIPMEAPQHKFNLDPGLAVAMQQTRLISEQARALRLENDQNDPKMPGGGPRKGDTAPVRALREGWRSFKDSELGKHVGPTIRAMGARGASGVLRDAYDYWIGSKPKISERKDSPSGWKKGPNPNW